MRGAIKFVSEATRKLRLGESDMTFKMIISDREEEKKRTHFRINATRLSYKMGYSVSHISRVIRRKTRPSTECLMHLADVLGLTMDETHRAIKEGRIYVGKAN